MAGWAVAQRDVMGCRHSKVLPEPPGNVHLDLVKKVSRTTWGETCIILRKQSYAVSLLNLVMRQ